MITFRYNQQKVGGVQPYFPKIDVTRLSGVPSRNLISNLKCIKAKNSLRRNFETLGGPYCLLSTGLGRPDVMESSPQPQWNSKIFAAEAANRVAVP
jgi:hypothetical protein